MVDEPIILNGRYRLLDRIGAGGMSIVYRAQDLSLGRIVAVKVLHENLTHDEGFLRRFQREAHAAANLSHPNIVTVHDIGQDGSRHYIVMEYVDGLTLKQMVRLLNQQGRPMSSDQALDLAVQTCAGIGYAHRAGLVHCDVKSQNILVTHDSRVKVADFGIAQALSEATMHTQDSQIWGTPHYFSPEQAAGQPATPASDVYAIGVVLFEMLTGRLPFMAETHTGLALQHMYEPAPPPSQFNAALSAQLDQIVLKVLSKEPAARYRTADQFGRILRAYRHDSIRATGAVPAFVYGLDDDRPTASYTRPKAAEGLGAAAVYVGASDPALASGTPAGQSASDGPDMLAISLGILAVLSLLGLIPLWYFVYLAYQG